MLVALLSDEGYEGFEESGSALLAYIPVNLFDRERLDEVVSSCQLRYTISTIPDTNWNAVWESNFQPVAVEDFCVVHAAFHHDFPRATHEILITPKMSFGTGHHATTFMMIRQMKDIAFEHTTVLDFGTGTGVLAILAERLGASKVLAIDNDEWSIANAAENLAGNQTRNIVLKQADTAAADDSFDVILANITLNVILDNFHLFLQQLARGGTLLLSGLLEADEPMIMEQAKAQKLQLQKKLVQDNWISLRFQK